MSDSRLEKFIYAICSMDVSDLPVPLSRIEKLWNCLITGETPDFEPLSRNEKYLMAMLDRYDISNLPSPMSRGEKLLYKIAVGETDLSDVPGYLSRYEELLKYLIENGGISGDDFEYVLYTINQSLYTLYTTAEKPVKSAILKGNTLVNLSKEKTITITTTTSDYVWNNRQVKLDSNLFKAGKKYLYSSKYSYTNDAFNNENPIYFIMRKNIAGATESILAKASSKVIFTIPTDFETTDTLYMRVHAAVGTAIDNTVTCDDIKILEYQEGMENWDIPYFRGMASVKMPVLTTSNEDGTKTNILTVNEDVELRGIGDVKDELNLLTGELTQHVKEVVLNGSEDWIRSADFSSLTNTVHFQIQSDTVGIEFGSPLISDKFINRLVWNRDIIEGISCATNGNLAISINRDRLSGLEVADFKKWLSQNNVTVVGKSTESIKTVDLTTVDQNNQPTQLGTFENITHVALESAGLIPEVEMEVATKLLEDTVFTLTDAFNTLYPTAAKPVVDGTLYGQTLVNIKGKETNDIKFNGYPSHDFLIPLVKKNTDYLIKYDTTISGGVLAIGFLKDAGGWSKNLEKQPNIGLIRLNSGEYPNYFRIIGEKGQTVSINNLMIIEYQDGMENWDIPYFDGMQSVQAPGVTMTGKNLINRQTMNSGYIDANGILQTNNTDLASDFIRISPNTNYTYKVFTNKTYDMRFTFFDENKSMIERTDSFRISNGRYKTYRSPSGAYYVRTHSNEFSNIGFDAGISLVMGDTPLSSYEPYKSITLSTPSDLELRKVGEVQDEVNVMTGEVVERIGELVLDGSQNWREYTTNTTNTYCGVIRDDIISNYKGTIYLNDKLAQLSDLDIDSEGIRINSGKRIFVRLNRNKGVTDLATFKQYLSQNPITIQYELATPTAKTVDLSVINQDGNETKLRTFDDTTHVLLNSEGLVPTASLTVRTKIPSASSTSLLMDDISTNQQQLETTIDEQSNNVDATMIATTEIYEETL